MHRACCLEYGRDGNEVLEKPLQPYVEAIENMSKMHEGSYTGVRTKALDMPAKSLVESPMMSPMNFDPTVHDLHSSFFFFCCWIRW